MDSESFISRSDISLLPFLQSSSEAETEEHLGSLVTEQAETVIKTVVKNKLRVSLNRSDSSRNNQDALELVADIQAMLISYLRNFKLQKFNLV